MERSCRILQGLPKFLQDLIKTLKDLSTIPEGLAMILQNLAENPSERSRQDPNKLGICFCHNCHDCSM